MKKVSRRAFSGAMLSASALAAAQERGGTANPANPAKVDLPPWQASPAGGDRFEFPGAPSPRTKWIMPGPPRKYFAEWLPALFERTLEIEELERREAAVAMDFHRAVRRLHGGSGRRQGAAGGALLRLAGAEPGAAGATASGPPSGGPVGGIQRRVWRRPEGHHGGGRLPVDGAGPVERERGALFPRGSGCEPAPTGLRGRGWSGAREAASAGHGSRDGGCGRRGAVPGDARVGRHHHASRLRGVEPAGRQGVVADSRRVQPAAASRVSHRRASEPGDDQLGPAGRMPRRTTTATTFPTARPAISNTCGGCGAWAER